MKIRMMRQIQSLFFCSVVLFSCGNEDNDFSPNSGNQGAGGSLARFAIADGFFYLVDYNSLNTFDLSDPMNPQFISSEDIGFDVETIFIMDSYIFIGTQTGMHIYEVDDSGKPSFVSVYEHIASCDPVIAQDSLAFVTLRTENICRDGMDVLEVIDIRDIKNPQLLHRKAMINPHGLGIQDSLLFVTEGMHGLKVYDVNAADQLQELQFIEGIAAFDVIPDKNLLIVTGEEGVSQYDFSDPSNLVLLSTISRDL